MATQCGNNSQQPNDQRSFTVRREHQWRQRRKVEGYSHFLQTHVSRSLRNSPLSHYLILVSHSIICFFPLNLMCFQLYRAADQAVPAEYPRDFLGISLPEQPNRYYFIIRSQKIVLEADSSIQMIMEKLQSYKSRVSLTFEVCLPISPAQEVFEI